MYILPVCKFSTVCIQMLSWATARLCLYYYTARPYNLLSHNSSVKMLNLYKTSDKITTLQDTASFVNYRYAGYVI